MVSGATTNDSFTISGNTNYVEIGGVKWATKNIGANSVTDSGLYFQWGDTSGYTASQVGTDKQFVWADYKYWTADTGNGSSGFTKYNDTDGLTTLESTDDAVIANWGGNWRMPTSGEMMSLINSTTSAWTADYKGSGVAGVVLTDNTDNTKELFFPAKGKCYNGQVRADAEYGYYFTNTVYTSKLNSAVSLTTYSSQTTISIMNTRVNGFTIRGVLDE
jgi:hypothetical protein